MSDDISLVRLLEKTTNATNDISHMKKSIDEIKDSIRDLVKEIKKERVKINSLELRFKWLTGIMIIMFGSIGTFIATFWKKILLILM